MARTPSLIPALLLVLATASSAPGQDNGSLRLNVTDGVTAAPLAGAHVTFPDLYLFWITDASGAVTATGIPVGTHRVEVSREGYEAARLIVDFEAGTRADGEVQLTPQNAGEAAEAAIIMRATDQTDRDDASIRLHLVDAESAAPLEGARVTFTELFRYWVSDGEGMVNVTAIPPGEHEIEITQFGYAPVHARLRFQRGAEARADVRLVSQPIQIEGVDVTVTSSARVPRLDRTGFYERMGSLLGHQVDRAAIQEMNPLVASDIIRRIPGVRLVLNDQGDLVAVSPRRFIADDQLVELDNSPETSTSVGRTRTRSGDLPPGTGCPMNLYLDGTRWDGQLDNLLVERIAGIEVYVGASEMPAQYSGVENGCGVILIWTE